MTTVLQKLELKAYRGIRDLTLDDLMPVSLIVGANNAGKSSILEAAGLVLRPLDPAQWITAVRQRDADGALVEGLWSIFPDTEALHVEDGARGSEPFVLEAMTTGGMRTVEARCIARQNPGTTEAAELRAQVLVFIDGDPAVTLKFPAAIPIDHQVALYRVFTVTPATHYSTSAMVEQLSRAIDEGRKQLAVELLQVFDRWVQDLDIIALPDRRAVRVTHKTYGVVDLSSFGDGMRRSAALALALTRANQGVLLVDEIEAGIHHAMLVPVLEKLIEAARLASVQILATTHSLEAVDAILTATEGTDTLSAFWLKRVGGKHEVRRYDHPKLKRLREEGLDIR